MIIYYNNTNEWPLYYTMLVATDQDKRAELFSLLYSPLNFMGVGRIKTQMQINVILFLYVIAANSSVQPL